MTIATVTILGRLTRDPETKYSQEGTAVCKLSVAVDGRKKDAPASFFDCVAFGKTAEFIAQYFAQGKPIMLVGELRQERWEDKQTGAKRSAVRIAIERATFVPTVGTQAQAQASDNQPMPKAAAQPVSYNDEDEPPF